MTSPTSPSQTHFTGFDDNTVTSGQHRDGWHHKFGSEKFFVLTVFIGRVCCEGDNGSSGDVRDGEVSAKFENHEIMCDCNGSEVLQIRGNNNDTHSYR